MNAIVLTVGLAVLAVAVVAGGAPAPAEPSVCVAADDSCAGEAGPAGPAGPRGPGSILRYASVGRVDLAPQACTQVAHVRIPVTGPGQLVLASNTMVVFSAYNTRPIQTSLGTTVDCPASPSPGFSTEDQQDTSGSQVGGETVLAGLRVVEVAESGTVDAYLSGFLPFCQSPCNANSNHVRFATLTATFHAAE